MSEPKNILFVDDKPSSHDYFRKRLDAQAYSVFMAFNLNEAVQAVIAKPITLVVLDLYFPGPIPAPLSNYYKRHGHELRLNQGQLFGLYCRDRKIPYFYLTAYSDVYRPDWESGEPAICLDKSKSDKNFMEIFKNTLGDAHE